jgi:tetratricopeptide (TPR) repeat protein
MQTKELISIVLSVVALTISVIATTISIIRGRLERQRAVRAQITDVLSRIISENTKLYDEAANKSKEYQQAISSILGQQNGFLLQQAIYLTDQVPELVSAVEYNTLALANADAGDLIVAENYYLKAIQISSNAYYKSLALRSYAVFLFPQRRFEEAREQFGKAVTLLKGADNLIRSTKGYTYQWICKPPQQRTASRA